MMHRCVTIYYCANDVCAGLQIMSFYNIGAPTRMGVVIPLGSSAGPEYNLTITMRVTREKE